MIRLMEIDYSAGICLNSPATSTLSFEPQAPSLRMEAPMRRVAAIALAVLSGIAFANLALAQSNDPIGGEWLITRINFGETVYHRITLKLENGKISGAFASG